jgi:hypothetical protein
VIDPLNDPVRLAIVGCGGMGRRHLAVREVSDLEAADCATDTGSHQPVLDYEIDLHLCLLDPVGAGA